MMAWLGSWALLLPPKCSNDGKARSLMKIKDPVARNDPRNWGMDHFN